VIRLLQSVLEKHRGTYAVVTTTHLAAAKRRRPDNLWRTTVVWHLRDLKTVKANGATWLLVDAYMHRGKWRFHYMRSDALNALKHLEEVEENG